MGRRIQDGVIMLTRAHLGIFIGFGIACVGFIALNYVNFSLQNTLGFRGFRSLTRGEYWRAVKKRRGSPWPLITASICIPLGIVIVFGTIIYNNHVRLK
jgi:hypothetical protein